MNPTRVFLPELSHIDGGVSGDEVETPAGANGALPVFVTLTGRMGCLFEVPLLDMESLELDVRAQALERLIASLPDGFLLRVIQRAAVSHEIRDDSFRAEAIEHLGFVSRRILLSIERECTDPLSLKSILGAVRRRQGALAVETESFRRALPVHELKGIGAKPLTRDEIRLEMSSPASPVLSRREVIDHGHAVTGVVRLYRPGTKAMDLRSLSSLLDSLPLPLEVSVTVKKLPKTRADLKLRARLARGQAFTDSTAHARQAATEKALSETSLQGGSLAEVEWLVTLSRQDEGTLRGDLEKVRSLLSQLGEAMMETVGGVPSYVSTRVGSQPHFPFLEEASAAPFYLPVFGCGEKTAAYGRGLQAAANGRGLQAAANGRGEGGEIDSVPTRSLLLHRLDGSLHAYDHFSPKFLAYNALICGKSGSGKSVLANALSSSLLQDPLVQMIKIDVGGSYRKECESFGGTEINFGLNSPSGINPFRFLLSANGRDRHPFGEATTPPPGPSLPGMDSGSPSRLPISNEAIEILSEFLATLIREEDEKQIPKALRANLEEALKKYAVSRPQTPSLDDFIAQSPGLSRGALLARWASGGVFENALKESTSSLAHSAVVPPVGVVPPQARYRYFNFENIQAAASRDYSEGVMAAVITVANLEMLRLGDRTRNPEGERLVLFCDETKFFIEKFARFFLLTAANFRKFGHGLVVMLQNIRDAEIKLSDGSLDRGLILNCPIRFFLQADTESQYLRDQFQFEEHHLSAVVTHPYRGKEYREAVLQDDTGTRVVRLYLTSDEYWRMTSTREDVEKLTSLRLAVPGLTLDQAIRCLGGL